MTDQEKLLALGMEKHGLISKEELLRILSGNEIKSGLSATALSAYEVEEAVQVFWSEWRKDYEAANRGDPNYRRSRLVPLQIDKPKSAKRKAKPKPEPEPEPRRRFFLVPE